MYKKGEGGQLGNDQSKDTNWRSQVTAFAKLEEFPLEPGDKVWILKPGFRAPVGPFIIEKILPNNAFELREEASGITYNELVDGGFLKRRPFL